MTNIWGFFEQTLTVSIVAAVLLVIKYLLIDKLSPRWQYGIYHERLRSDSGVDGWGGGEGEQI